jgi:hypothetical protein
MNRHLAVAVLAVLGVLVWASAAPAAEVLTLCIKSGGSIRAAGNCSAQETAFKVVSQADFNALEARVATLEGKVNELEALLAGVSRPDASTLLLSGMNLRVVNGSGSTEGSENGLGNVIIGYNRDRGDVKTGSHNLVIGDFHTYTNASGIVSGNNNNLTGLYSFVAGDRNTASGFGSFVAGGINNTASANFSLASGTLNTASGDSSFVGGGFFNNASAPLTFVGGGRNNTASGDNSFIGGGTANTAGPGACGFVISTAFGTC